MPDAFFKAKVITVVEDDALRARPFRTVTATDAAQVFVILGQAVAARMIPVMPQGTQITHAHGIGIPGDGLEEVVAVERQISGGFSHVFQTLLFNVFSIMARVPPRRTNSRTSFAGGT